MIDDDVERVEIDIDIDIGVVVPRTVRYYPLPPRIIEIVPEFEGYVYFVLVDGRIVIDVTGSSSTIEHRPLPADDPKVRRPDITRARERLGWEPRVPVREGVARTADYFRSLGRDAVGSATG